MNTHHQMTCWLLLIVGPFAAYLVADAIGLDAVSIARFVWDRSWPN